MGGNPALSITCTGLPATAFAVMKIPMIFTAD